MTRPQSVVPPRIVLSGDVRAGLLLALFALVFMAGRCARSGEGIPGSDVANEDYPWRTFWATSLRAGRVPLWNPYEMAGVPFAANPLVGVFYPPNVVYLLLPFGPALALFEAFHLALGGVGTVAFLRRRGISSRPALLAGTAWMFSGVLIAHLDSPRPLQTTAWLPVILWSLERAWQERRPSDIAVASAAVGLQFLAGSLPYNHATAVATGAYALYRTVAVWAAGRGPRAPSLLLPDAATGPAARPGNKGGTASGWRGLLLTYFLIWGLGALLAAVMLLPAVEYVLLSARSGLGSDLAAARSYPLENLLTWLIPDLFGSSVTHNAMQGSVYFETTAYVGVLPLILAGLALGGRRSPQRGDAWFFAGLALGAGLLALGPATPLYAIARVVIPGFGLTGDPYRLIWLSGVAVSLLAGYGAERLLSGQVGPGGVRRLGRLLVWAGGLAWGGVAAFALARPLYMSLGASLIPRAYADPEEKIAKLPSLYQLQLQELAVFAALLSALALALWLFRRGPEDPALMLRPKRFGTLGKLSPRWLGNVLVPLALADVWAFGLKFVWAGPYVAEPGYPACVQQALAGQESRVLPVDTAVDAVGFKGGLVSNIASPLGYEPLMQRKYRELLAAVERVPEAALDVRAPRATRYNSPGWAAFNVGYLLSDRPLEGDLVEVAACRGLRLYAAPRVARPGWVAQSVVWVEPGWRPAQDEAAGMGPQGPVYAEILGGRTPEVAHAAGSSGQVTLLERTPERSVWDIDLAQRGVVVWSESWHPGWRATIDGRPAEALRANHAFLAVQAPAGPHQLEWVFDPLTFKLGAGLSLIGLCAIGLLVWLGARRT